MGNEVENLQALLKQDPSNFQARRELAIILTDNGFNEEALSNLEYLQKYFPEDAELQYNLGILYEKTKNIKKARKAYEKAISISPQPDFYYNLGEVLVELKEWDLAIEALNSVLKTDVNDGNCYFNLGLCYLNKDEINKATDCFQKAVELNPKDLYAYFYLGNIYQNNGLTNFAEESYKKVLEISPDYSWAYYNLASIAYKNDNLDEAREYLSKTILYNDTDIESYKLLAKICAKQNDYDEMFDLLNTRLSKEENGDLLYVLAQLYRRTGQQREYIVCLEQAIENPLTLTYKIDLVKKELKNAESQNGNSDFTEEYDEYTSDDEEFSDDEEENSEDETDSSDFEEDDFDNNEDIQEELEEDTE
ncbi:MAG: tetratricopeptide repeat protein [bacterium]|nr:tetratricopeptide repeat protein [bacterium]